MKVGYRIRVFEIQLGYYVPELIGKLSAERIDNYFGCKYGINICYGLKTKNDQYMSFHANIDNGDVKANHVKHVCTMVIKSIKS